MVPTMVEDGAALRTEYRCKYCDAAARYVRRYRIYGGNMSDRGLIVHVNHDEYCPIRIQKARYNW